MSIYIYPIGWYNKVKFKLGDANMEFNWLLERPIAHRGFWGEGCAENSLTSYQRAIDKGYNIEIDVHLLADDTFAVFHDNDLKRVCGEDIKVRDLTALDLKKYHLSGTEDTIPTLEEVLSLVNGQVALLIEMKDFTNRNDACQKLYNVLKEYKGQYAIQSFNIAAHNTALRWWRKNVKDVPIGILSTRPLDVVLPCWRKTIDPDFYAFDIKGLPVSFIEKQRKLRGVKLLSWTIRDEAQYEKARRIPVDNIIFDTLRLDKWGL